MVTATRRYLDTRGVPVLRRLVWDPPGIFAQLSTRGVGLAHLVSDNRYDKARDLEARWTRIERGELPEVNFTDLVGSKGELTSATMLGARILEVGDGDTRRPEPYCLELVDGYGDLLYGETSATLAQTNRCFLFKGDDPGRWQANFGISILPTDYQDWVELRGWLTDADFRRHVYVVGKAPYEKVLTCWVNPEHLRPMADLFDFLFVPPALRIEPFDRRLRSRLLDRQD